MLKGEHTLSFLLEEFIAGCLAAGSLGVWVTHVVGYVVVQLVKVLETSQQIFRSVDKECQSD